jgi:ribosome-interacting GTPase 1
MPANLTPEYKRAEERFRLAKSPDEKLAALEEMLRVMPKHKGTDGLQADIKARIAKLKKQPATKTGRSTFSHMVPREGAGQVALVGPPNTGKSALVAALTHATPTVADYPFTTREATPGMMPFEDIAFQLVDLPPLSDQHLDPWIIDLIRAADLLWLVLDGRYALEGMDDTERLLGERSIGVVPACEEAAGAARAGGGGLAPGTTDQGLAPFDSHLALPLAQGRPGTRDQGPGTIKNAVVVLTGADRPEVAESVDVVRELFGQRWPIVAVSATDRTGFDELATRTFDALRIMRVYTKQPGRPADRDKPFTLPRGATVADLAARIHKDLLANMKFARVWGANVFDGQTVQRDHVLSEGDVIEIHE